MLADKVRSHAPRPEGLEVLIPSRQDDTREIDIVFIHGLGGHALKSWWHAESKASVPWIADYAFLGDIYDKARIMTFGYNADLRRKVSSHRIIDHANDLLEGLVEVRRSCQDRPLMFVAHSMGGLVVKKALILCHDDVRYQDIQSMTRSVIFLGTPHEGSEQADNLQVLLGLASLLKIKVSDISEELESYSVTTMDINKSFMRNTSRKLRILCFYETVKTRLPHGDRLIVRESSAQLNGNFSQNVSMSCAHSELCKFGSPQDFRFKNIFFRKFKAFVEDAITYNLDGVGHEEPQAIEQIEKPSWSGPMIDYRSSEQQTSRLKVSDAQRNFTLDDLKELSRFWITNAAEMQTPKKSIVEDRSKEAFLASLSGFTAANLGQGVGSPHPGTCSWIDDHPVFNRDWISAKQSRLLLITGDSGSGKSCLARHIRDRLRDSSDEPNMVLAFFCNSTRAQAEDNDEPAIMSYFIKELVSQFPELYRHVNEYRSLEHAPGNLSFEAQMDIMSRIAKHSREGKIFLIVDGLDECSPGFASKFLRSIRYMLLDTSPGSPRVVNRIRIAVISRPTPAISPNVSDLHIVLATDDVEADIAKFVHESVQDLSLQDDKTAVATGITDLAGHSFLWAVSTIRQLEVLSDTSRDGIVAMLSRCPQDMEEYYEQAIADLAPTEDSLGRQILLLVLRARRPLRKPEARQAASILMGYAVTESEMETCLRLMSTSLLRIDADEVLSLFHYSLREYLSNKHISGADHCRMFNTCIRCIMAVADDNDLDLLLLAPYGSNNRDARDAERDTEVLRLWREYPFFSYAQVFLFDHAFDSGQDIVSCIPLLQRYVSPESHYHRWRGLSFLSEDLRLYGSGPSFLGDMAVHGLSDLLQHTLLVKPFRDRSWASLFDYAAWQSRAKLWIQRSTMRLVLHTSIIDKGSNNNTILHFAAGSKRFAPEFAMLYINEALSVEPLTSNGISPLQSAASQGNLQAMKFLLALGADPLHGSGDVMKSALQHSAVHGELDALRLILTEGLSNAKMPVIATAGQASEHGNKRSEDLEHSRKDFIQAKLQKALLGSVYNGHVEAAELLRNHGADARDIRIVLEGAPTEHPILHHTMRRGHDEMVFWLLCHGGLPCIDEHAGIDALGVALSLSRIDYADAIITKLLQRHLSAACFDTHWSPYGWTSVHLAVVTGTLEITQRLLEGGASPNAVNSDGELPLHLAVRIEDQEKTQLLLEHGSHLDVLDCWDQTPLILACLLPSESSALRISDSLLTAGADTRTHDHPGSCAGPLTAAASQGYNLVLARLLDAKYAPNLNGNGDLTPLLCAVRENHLETAQLLLSRGALTTTRNPPLWSAVAQGNADMVRLLLQHGADVLYYGPNISAIHLAACSGNIEILKLLTGQVTPADIEDLETQTGNHPLRFALEEDQRRCSMHLIKFCDNARPTDREHWELLQFAAVGGNVRLLRHLLYEQDWKRLINPPLPLRGGYRGPFQTACLCGHLKAVKFLLREGADPTMTDAQGTFASTALASCIDSDEPTALKIARYLLSYHSEIWQFSKQHLTCALAWAILGRKGTFVQLLLDRGAEAGSTYKFEVSEGLITCFVQDVPDDARSETPEPEADAPSMRTTSPLHAAINMQDGDTVTSILRNSKTDIFVQDDYGDSALHYACRKDNQTMLSLLLLGVGETSTPFTMQDSDRLLMVRNRYAHTALTLRMGRSLGPTSDRISRLQNALTCHDAETEAGRQAQSLLVVSHYLLLLEDDSLATSGFQMARSYMALSDAMGDLCDRCDEMAPSQLMSTCRRCSLRIFCESCYTEHLKGETSFLACRSHSYLTIPTKEVSDTDDSLGLQCKTRSAAGDSQKTSLNAEIQSWLSLVKEKYGFKSADGSVVKGFDRTIEIEAASCVATKIAAQLRPVRMTTALLGIDMMDSRVNTGAEEMVSIEKVWDYVRKTLRQVEGWEYLDYLEGFWQLSE